MHGYQPGDPVRVELPLEVNGERVTCEGTIRRALADGYFRVVLTAKHKIGECIIERVTVRATHFI